MGAVWASLIAATRWLGRLIKVVTGVAYDWLRGRRLLAVVLALVLVAVPTAFGIFPELISDVTLGDRAWIMGAWVTIAGFTAVAAMTERSEGQSMALEHLRLLTRSYLKLALDPKNSGIPVLYEVTVYFDDDQGHLLPWFPRSIRGLNDPRVFAYGKGATGKAFSANDPIAVVGDAVSSDEYGLTPSQQEFFARYRVVVAVPITELGSGRVLGALTVINTHNDEMFVTDEGIDQPGVSILQRLADEIGDAVSTKRGKVRAMAPIVQRSKTGKGAMVIFSQTDAERAARRRARQQRAKAEAKDAEMTTGQIRVISGGSRASRSR